MAAHRLCIVAVLTCVAVSASAENWRDEYGEGTRQFDVGDYRAALESFKRAYLVHDEAGILFDIGECHRMLGENKEAVFSYRSYLRRKPDAGNRAAVEAVIAKLEGAAAQPSAPASVVASSPAAGAPTRPASTTPPAASATATPPAAVPVAAAAPPAPTPAVADLPTAGSAHNSDPGWSQSAAGVGFANAIAVFVLGLASELTLPNLVPSLPVGTTALVLHIAGVPIVDAGDRATRARAGVRGVPGLRVAAWIFYGTAIAVYSIAGAYYGSHNEAPPTGLITGGMTLPAVLSNVLFATDAVIVHAQAQQRRFAHIRPTLTGLAGTF
jgi:tetratricopeptide (TPR) repeat protein